MDFDEEQLVNLVISASDPSARTGLGLDQKTIHALGGQSASVSTGVLLEDADGGSRFAGLDMQSIREQMECAERYLNLGSIKVGWLPNENVVEGLADVLPSSGEVPVVVDLRWVSRGQFASKERMKQAMERTLLPGASLITLGCSEASEWSGRCIGTPHEAEGVAAELSRRWNVPVLVTGGDLHEDEDAVDVLGDGEMVRRFRGFRLQIESVLGKGDCLSAAIAAQLGSGATLGHAIDEAKCAVARWLLTVVSVGPGIRVLSPSVDPVAPHPPYA